MTNEKRLYASRVGKPVTFYLAWKNGQKQGTFETLDQAWAAKTALGKGAIVTRTTEQLVLSTSRSK